MEIRLLVNGNLVHTVTMADLELITSKRDIYFATTAPEFIPKDFRIKGIENEQDNDTSSKITKGTSEYSNERILEIKHKLEAQHMDVDLLSPKHAQIESNMDMSTFHINSQDNLNKYLPLPLTNSEHCMQRARSLQKPRSCLLDEQKRQISKSNSCGDSYASNSDKEFSPNRQHIPAEPPVPPNSPKTSSSDSPVSPTKKYCKLPPSTRSQLHYNNNDVNSPEKVKPLRIFRIPISNLTGTHSHYHTHNSIPKVSKIQTNKIDEDNLETEEISCPITLESNNKQTCDKIGLLNDKFNNITCKCSNEPLFSSL